MDWHDQFSQISSPNINALRQTGITLDQYYVARFCSPTRSTFMSGRYPWHVGQQTDMNLNPTPGIACGINLNYTFLPALLKRQNYTTWALGKWHLGFYRKEYTPTARVRARVRAVLRKEESCLLVRR
jgi:arylsulfatase A-like enzyme